MGDPGLIHHASISHDLAVNAGTRGTNPKADQIDMMQQMDNICLQNGGGNGNRTAFAVHVCLNRLMLRLAPAFQQASFCILRRRS